MKQHLDARGLACPQPVVLTHKALTSATEELTVIVDNAAAVENVTRLARSKGFAVEKAERPDGIYLCLQREGSRPRSEEEPQPPLLRPQASGDGDGPLVIFVQGDSLGRGSAELGERLMGAFFYALLEAEPKPQTLIFLNMGVKLTVEGSRLLEELRALEAQGTEILACGTCLGFFELTEKLAVGRIANMYDIVTVLLQAGRLVQL
jgi:selenium metabolism protein YedF